MEFGRYKLLPGRREVLADGKPLQVGGRAFDVLLRLVEAQGALVGKDDLLRAVWPGQIVDEDALQAQISALRRTSPQSAISSDPSRAGAISCPPKCAPAFPPRPSASRAPFHSGSPS